MLANTSGGMTAQGMNTINHDDLTEDGVNIHVIGSATGVSYGIAIWKVMVHI